MFLAHPKLNVPMDALTLSLINTQLHVVDTLVTGVRGAAQCVFHAQNPTLFHNQVTMLTSAVKINPITMKHDLKEIRLRNLTP